MFKSRFRGVRLLLFVVGDLDASDLKLFCFALPESVTVFFCIFGDFAVLAVPVDLSRADEFDGLLIRLADDLNSFSCPSVNAESNFLLTDSAISDTCSNIADCH